MKKNSLLPGTPYNFRLGTKMGFQNILKAQCHCIGTAAMNESSGSVHENVVGYDPSHLDTYLDHEVDMAQHLDMFKHYVFSLNFFVETTVGLSENLTILNHPVPASQRYPAFRA